MLFHTLWLMFFSLVVIMFGVLNQQIVTLHLFFCNVSLPLSILIFLTLLLGSFFQSLHVLYGYIILFFRKKT
jgi:uncharacterized integral membrane protein